MASCGAVHRDPVRGLSRGWQATGTVARESLCRIRVPAPPRRRGPMGGGAAHGSEALGTAAGRGHRHAPGASTGVVHKVMPPPQGARQRAAQSRPLCPCRIHIDGVSEGSNVSITCPNAENLTTPFSCRHHVQGGGPSEYRPGMGVQGSFRLGHSGETAQGSRAALAEVGQIGPGPSAGRTSNASLQAQERPSKSIDRSNGGD